MERLITLRDRASPCSMTTNLPRIIVKYYLKYTVKLVRTQQAATLFRRAAAAPPCGLVSSSDATNPLSELNTVALNQEAVPMQPTTFRTKCCGAESTRTRVPPSLSFSLSQCFHGFTLATPAFCPPYLPTSPPSCFNFFYVFLCCLVVSDLHTYIRPTFEM